jgi:hypothetical protein
MISMVILPCKKYLIFLEDPNYQLLGFGPVQQFLSDIFDQKDISVKSAVQELTLKTTE